MCFRLCFLELGVISSLFLVCFIRLVEARFVRI